MNSHQLINGTNMDVEYFTPQPIIEAARMALGGTIALDPASSEAANKRVDALRWFGVEADGITQKWEASTVFLNHPFGRAEPACSPDCRKKHVHHTFPLHGNAAWINKLGAEFLDMRAESVCCITFACTSEKWFQPLLRFPQCFLSPRTNYLTPDGKIKKGVTKGSCVTYLGPDLDRFRSAFAKLGVVKV